MTPALHRSDAGNTLEPNTSGAMNLHKPEPAPQKGDYTLGKGPTQSMIAMIKQHVIRLPRTTRGPALTTLYLSHGSRPHQGVPSSPRSVRGSSWGSKNTARPKSMAFRGAFSSSLDSMKLPAQTHAFEIQLRTTNVHQTPAKPAMNLGLRTRLNVTVEQVLPVALSQRAENGSHETGNLHSSNATHSDSQ